jgi:hypothetical protein
MKITKIELEQAFNSLKMQTELIGERGHGVHKSIELRLTFDKEEIRKHFVVIDHRKGIYYGPSIDEATEIYNNVN